LSVPIIILAFPPRLIPPRHLPSRIKTDKVFDGGTKYPADFSMQGPLKIVLHKSTINTTNGRWSRMGRRAIVRTQREYQLIFMPIKIVMIGAGSIGFTRRLMQDVAAVSDKGDLTRAPA
jgi:hypothetical protein